MVNPYDMDGWIPVPVTSQLLQFLQVRLELNARVLVVDFGQGSVDGCPGGNLVSCVLDPGDRLTTINHIISITQTLYNTNESKY